MTVVRSFTLVSSVVLWGTPPLSMVTFLWRTFPLVSRVPSRKASPLVLSVVLSPLVLSVVLSPLVLGVVFRILSLSLKVSVFSALWIIIYRASLNPASPLVSTLIFQTLRFWKLHSKRVNKKPHWKRVNQNHTGNEWIKTTIETSEVIFSSSRMIPGFFGAGSANRPSTKRPLASNLLENPLHSFRVYFTSSSLVSSVVYIFTRFECSWDLRRIASPSSLVRSSRRSCLRIRRFYTRFEWRLKLH